MKGEIKLLYLYFEVECANCDEYIDDDFQSKEDFEKYLTKKGWKTGYENNAEVWYCPQCVKEFEGSKRRAGRQNTITRFSANKTDS